MDEMKYFYEVYEALPRCGPGENGSTKRAFNVIPPLAEKPRILDIGCGTGMQTICLAKNSTGEILALDNHLPFLDKLMENAADEGVGDHIIPAHMSMLEMNFDDETFDIIWSEGALYFMGFQNGLKKCRQLLKNNGYLAVTEVVYLLPDPPAPLREFWEKEYPVIRDVKSNIKAIEKQGLQLLSNFTLPKSAWLECYYAPMEKVLAHLTKKYRGNHAALDIYTDMQHEIEIYKTYSDYYGYEFFIMQKRD